MKVLIAAPISGHKQYSINEWFKWISNQSHKEYSYALCVNGSDQSKLVSMLKKAEITDVHGQTKKPIIIWNTVKPGVKTTMLHNIVHARESLRKYAVEHNYDKILFLDTDTIPKSLNAIEQLSKGSDVTSGLYFYKGTTQPVAVSVETKTNFTVDVLEKAVNEKKNLDAELFGFGCVLIDKIVFSLIKFEYSEFDKELGDDYGYCWALKKKHIKRTLNPAVICYHLGQKQKNDSVVQVGR